MTIVITFQSKDSLFWAPSDLDLSRSVLIIPETRGRQIISCEVRYNMKPGGWWEEERWGILPLSCSWEPFNSTLRSSLVLSPVTASFVGHIFAMNFCLLAVAASQGHIIDHLLTFLHKTTPQTYFLCFLLLLVYGFPLRSNKTLGESS